jgi:hypothetical protein
MRRYFTIERPTLSMITTTSVLYITGRTEQQRLGGDRLQLMQLTLSEYTSDEFVAESQ